MSLHPLKACLLAFAITSTLAVSGAHAEIKLSPAASQIIKGDAQKEDPIPGPPDDYETLKIGDLIVGEKEGQIHFISGNGRYVFTGRMIDVWEQKEIRSADDLRATKDKVNLKNMGFIPENLNAFIVGQGNKQEVSIFIDPLCSFCDKLIKEARQIAASNNNYQFNFIVVPALGEESNVLAKAFYCSKDPVAAKVEALLNRKINELSQPETCDTSKYDLTLFAATTVGVTGVPYLIHPSGKRTAGTPTNLMYWLEDKN